MSTPRKTPSSLRPTGRSNKTPYQRHRPSEQSSSPASRTLTVEGVGAAITKKDVVLAFQDMYNDVSSISLNPQNGWSALIQFKTRFAAERAFTAKLGYATIQGKRFAVKWNPEQTGQPEVPFIIPPPPPDLFPQEAMGAQSRGFGRGTYDPQFRQMGHFMDTSQLVVGPGEKPKMIGRGRSGGKKKTN